MRASRPSFLCLACAVFFANAHGQESVDYATEIKPLLQEKCWSCHGVLKQESGLRLDHRELMLAGGDSGSVVDLEATSESLLLTRVQTNDVDLRMPPVGEGSELSVVQVDLLKRWIKGGAKAPDEDIVASPLDHWAFQAVDLSVNRRLGDGTNPIDALLNAKHQALGLKAVDQADRSLLIRRLYLNVIGLPPTVQQLQDTRPLEQIIDKLLTSPQHGERWARHWMDVWRYSDWYGLGKQLRYSQKHMWHWRDWIVKSLNDDKGYDRMVLEMLAGDELDPSNPDAITATGFLARNYYLFNRTTWLDQTIEHTGKAFLGLTLNCAKCHDHKYDPISHVDYYQFRALFEPHHIRLDLIPGVVDPDKDGLPRAFDRNADAVTQLHVRGDPKNLDESLLIKPSVPALFAKWQPEIQSVSLPPEAYAPVMRDDVVDQIRQGLVDAIEVAEEKFAAAAKDLEQSAVIADAGDSDVTVADTESQKAWLFEDQFDSLDTERWEVVGAWSEGSGKVIRTTATRDEEFLRLKELLPDDFELTCRYTTTGGATYKSVTFRFDESEDRRFANFVYTSAHQPGPKVQIAEVRQGKSSYPAAGRAGRKIEVGQAYELKIAVRNRLVNVWLDGEFALSYELSDRGFDRRLSLSGFDATVAFDSIRVRSLPASIRMTPAASGATGETLSVEQAYQLAVAKRSLEQQRLKEFDAVIAADQCKAKRIAGRVVPGQKKLAQTAAYEQAQLRLKEAQWKLLKLGDTPENLTALKKQVESAEGKLATVVEDGGDYLSPMLAMVALTGPGDDQSKHETMFLPTSTGRRLALAEWIVSEQNPLMARVAVNHVWLRHFGEPLVESVFDFGLRAKEPVHLDVLDCLAAEFIQSGYSFRHLHRLILTSEAYQRTTSSLHGDAETRKVDPANKYLWKMNTRRMESQVVRDSLLQLAGTLDVTMGGASVAVGPDSRRRSLYFLHSRDQHDLFLSTFDDADLLQCYRRSESVVPQQALALANSKLALTAAAEIEKRISETVSELDQVEFIQAAFETLLARAATGQEVQACVGFCQQVDDLLTKEAVAETDRTSRIRKRLIDSLLNHNDFISIR